MTKFSFPNEEISRPLVNVIKRFEDVFNNAKAFLSLFVSIWIYSIIKHHYFVIEVPPVWHS